jgi:hypothetical protein
MVSRRYVYRLREVCKRTTHKLHRVVGERLVRIEITSTEEGVGADPLRQVHDVPQCVAKSLAAPPCGIAQKARERSVEM